MGFFKKIFGGRTVFRKLIHDMPLNEQIEKFNEKYPDRTVMVPIEELLIWHHVFTGGCVDGQKKFCKEHNLDQDNGRATINTFIELAKTGFRGKIFEKLEKTKPNPDISLKKDD